MAFSGEELQKIRKAARISQEDLALHLNVTRETISHIETNKPGAIKALGVEKVRDWWFFCRGKIPETQKLKFIDTIKTYFGI